MSDDQLVWSWVVFILLWVFHGWRIAGWRFVNAEGAGEKIPDTAHIIVAWVFMWPLAIVSHAVRGALRKRR